MASISPASPSVGRAVISPVASSSSRVRTSNASLLAPASMRRRGFDGIAQRPSTEGWFFEAEPRMESAFTSKGTNAVPCTKIDRSNARPSRGGQRTCVQCVRGARFDAPVRASMRLMPFTWKGTSSASTWPRILRQVVAFGFLCPLPSPDRSRAGFIRRADDAAPVRR